MKKDHNNIKNKKEQKEYNKTKIKRVNHNIILYIILVFFNVYYGIQKIFYFVSGFSQTFFMILLFIVPVLAMIIFIINTYLLAKQAGIPCKQVLKLFFMIDGIFFAFLTADVTYLMNIVLTSQGNVIQYFTIPLFVCFFFIKAGSYRVTILTVLWNKSQTIMMKLSFMINGLFQLFITGWLFVANPVITQDKQFDISIRDLNILVTLSLFAFYFQLYNKVSDFDGVNNFQTKYILAGQWQDKQQIQILIYGLKQKHKNKNDKPQSKKLQISIFNITQNEINQNQQ